MSDPAPRSRLAPAKVNLFLHVGAPDPTGYHPLSSLVVFANVGDQVRLEPGDEADFVVEGPFAAKCGAPEDNLMLKAEKAFLEAYGQALPSARLVLDKHLPVASGLGGGSSDAAATLHLLNDLAGEPFTRDELAEIGRKIGADGPMCVRGEAALAEGIGDQLSAAPRLPELYGVLVNPLVPVSTAEVYRAFDRNIPERSSLRPDLPEGFETVQELIAWLNAHTQNDLEAPAKGLADDIEQVLFLLRYQPQTLFARMSGSGATCFALCDSEASARALAVSMFIGAPDWWVRPCRLA